MNTHITKPINLIVQGLRDREFTAYELISQSIEMAKLNQHNSVVQVFEDYALERAAEIDALTKKPRNHWDENHF